MDPDARSAAPQDARTLRSDLEWLCERAETAGREAEQKIESTVRQEPFLAVGAALGLGFLLGGGVQRSTWTVLLGVGSRMLAAKVGSDVLERFGGDAWPAGDER
jgi:hypothetical protein